MMGIQIQCERSICGKNLFGLDECIDISAYTLKKSFLRNYPSATKLQKYVG